MKPALAVTSREGPLALLLAGALGLTSGCRRQATAPTEPDPGTAAAVAATAAEGASAAAAAVAVDPALFPRRGGVAGYVGADTCRACHEDQYASWHRTYHRTMTQWPTPEAVKADFNDVVLTNAGVRFTLRRRGDEFFVHMESEHPGTPDRPAPEPVEVPLGLVTGSHHMQVFWVPNGLGNCQVGFPFTWLIPEGRWVPRNSTFIRPPDFEHRPETWNHVCARCHATATQPNLDRASLTWHTQVQELGIACEACHGPGERHVAWARARETTASGAERGRSRIPPAEDDDGEAQGGSARPAGGTPAGRGPADEDMFIVQPKHLPPERAAQVCGFCHSMKWWDQREGWPERGFSFRPGDDLEATTPIIRPKELDRQPWLRQVLAKQPDLFRDFFWSDGMVRVSGREYNGLIESPCYRGGRFSCLSCHSMHRSDPNDLLARNRVGNQACTQCHADFREAAAVAAHTRHRADSSGSECYNCHMPHTTYGVLSAIRSHQVSSPSVADQLATGRPNACNLCHLDQPLAWTAEHLAQWYQQPQPALSTEQTEVAEVVRLALTGDAGQRALAAWHLGWAPAVAVSGSWWLAPVLGQLLDDPYAAVRCVAERSLKRLAEPVPVGYDYATAPGARPAMREVVLEAWTRRSASIARPATATAVLVRPEDPRATLEAFDRLLPQRDDRPVRLRE